MEENFAPEGSIDAAALKALCRRSDAAGLRHLAAHGAALGATGAGVAAALGTVWLAPALLAHGLVLTFLFAPLHECIHRTAFARRTLNDSVAWICGLFLFLPPAYFRTFHFAHHRHTQDPGRDPELLRPKPRTVSEYLLHVSGLPYWRERIGTLIRHAGGRVDEAFIPARQRPAIVGEARRVLAAYAAVAVASLVTGSWAALQYWIVPALIAQPALRLFLLAEHTGCPLVAEMFRNSRTTQTTRPVRWLAWNMPYHAEHHAYPAVPFHALPAAHALLRDKLAVLAPGYLGVQRDIWAGVRVGRMTTKTGL